MRKIAKCDYFYLSQNIQEKENSEFKLAKIKETTL